MARFGEALVNVGGKTYDRFMSLNLRRSKAEGCASGTIVMAWPGSEHMVVHGRVAPELVDGAYGWIILEGQMAAHIIFDSRVSKGTPNSYELSLPFRGRCSVLVESCPRHQTGQFNQQTANAIISQLTDGFQPSYQGGGNGMDAMIKRFIIAEGETVERAARRAGREFGITFWEDRFGNWTTQEPGSGGGTIELGKNFTHWSVKRDMGPRSGELQMSGAGIPTDEKYGKIVEKISDKMGINLFGGGGEKMLRIPVDSDHTDQTMQQRNAMERDSRMGQGLNVTVRMPNWVDDAGALWDIGAKYMVIIPVDGVNSMCEVIEVEFELTTDSKSATVTLKGDPASATGGVENILIDQGRRIGEQPQQPETPPPPGAGPDGTAV